MADTGSDMDTVTNIDAGVSSRHVVPLETRGRTIDPTIAPVEHDGWTNWWPEQRKQR